MSEQSSPEVPPAARLAAAYKRLATAATEYREATKEFSAPIDAIDRALRALDIDVITWKKMAGDEDEYGAYWHRDVGYARIKGDWCLAIRTVRGHEQAEEDDIEQWPFGAAPSSLRIEAIDKLPDLLEQLIRNAEKTTKKLRERTGEARKLAAALAEAKQEMKAQQKERR